MDTCRIFLVSKVSDLAIQKDASYGLDPREEKTPTVFGEFIGSL